ncbi:hypothetical protein LOK49_LG02G00686 [Camellia lanceoleosa]|uniref:Uncharacterized protein n=1 Tax=Camellia lanceoleosa TaxID=1840588 RepID=A0ACC0IG89_9ERIC|nr:hypothetical protein LOK49_LG02G00686 [Camellia lanceoleosa]
MVGHHQFFPFFCDRGYDHDPTGLRCTHRPRHRRWTHSLRRRYGSVGGCLDASIGGTPACRQSFREGSVYLVLFPFPAATDGA